MSKSDEDETRTIESDETEVLVDLNHDAFMRHVSIHVHMDRPMRPEEFIAELADVVAEYQERPEELFAMASLIDVQ
jgi:hypothetical protein